MTFAEFKRNAVSELRSYYNILIALHYFKKAKKHLHTDIRLSIAYKNVAEVYGQRSKDFKII